MKNLILSTAMLTLTASLAFADTVRIATEGAYPPYNFINDNGQIDGFERELGDALCARAQLECVWLTNDWDSIIQNLVSGNYSAIMAGMSITPERDAVIDFSAAYLPPDPSTYVGLAGSEFLMEVGVVAAQIGTIQSNYIATTGRTLIEFATADETISAVLNGEADAVFADKTYLAPIVAESGGKLDYVYQDVMVGGGIGMGFRESDIDLRFQFEDAIYDMTQDGSLNTLIRKWFGEDATVWE